MEPVAQNTETLIRLGLFAGFFLSFSIAEYLWPRKSLTAPKISRWFGNLSITVGNNVLLRLVFIGLGATAVGIAGIAQAKGWGLLSHVNLPPMVVFVLGLLLLDLAIYAQHLVLHRIPVLWRLHRMHHADTDIDVSTGLRFHPLEIIVSMALKIGLIILLGVPPMAVLVFEIVLNATSMFNHTNMALPQSVDRLLRLIVVTPDIHRVHHSVHEHEYNRNFGFNVPWWDKLFGTYQAQPEDGHDQMLIGLHQYRDPKWQSLGGLLAIPFNADENAEAGPS